MISHWSSTLRLLPPSMTISWHTTGILVNTLLIDSIGKSLNSGDLGGCHFIIILSFTKSCCMYFCFASFVPCPPALSRIMLIERSQEIHGVWWRISAPIKFIFGSIKNELQEQLHSTTVPCGLKHVISRSSKVRLCTSPFLSFPLLWIFYCLIVPHFYVHDSSIYFNVINEMEADGVRDVFIDFVCIQYYFF
jgi:hypothetical protein